MPLVGVEGIARMTRGCVVWLRHLILILAFLSCAAEEAFAQTLWVGGAVAIDVQRFPQDATPNRLDGESLGWTALGGMTLWKRIAVAAEWVDAGTIDDVRQTSLDVNGRRVSITSTFQHRTRGIAILSGYQHALGRAQFAYLLGVHMTDIERRFVSDAASIVLILPSQTTPSTAVVLSDRSVSMVGAVNVLIRTSDHLALVSGVRIHRLPLETDFSGLSVRTVIGATWRF